jgi:NADPH-dependent curcumin reductase CurA
MVRNHYVSIDPTMRGWIRDTPSYLPPVQIGEVMRALTVGQVVESKVDGFSAGDFVAGVGGVQDYSLTDGSFLSPVDVSISPLENYLNTLGIAGLTAYSGLIEVGQLQPGNTVLVSGAAGSVGAHVGQIAKIKGCHVVGVAGGAEKCAYLKELGFDEAIDYKNEDLAARVAATCPKGIDVFFDNVGGEILEVALANLAMGARVVLCGAISIYNATAPVPGPSNYMALVIKRARMEGFIYLDYRNQWADMMRDMAGWIATGQLTCKNDIVEGGVAKFPETLPKLFTGENFGKLMIRLI